MGIHSRRPSHRCADASLEPPQIKFRIFLYHKYPLLGPLQSYPLLLTASTPILSLTALINFKTFCIWEHHVSGLEVQVSFWVAFVAQCVALKICPPCLQVQIPSIQFSTLWVDVPCLAIHPLEDIWSVAHSLFLPVKIGTVLRFFYADRNFHFRIISVWVYGWSVNVGVWGWMLSLRGISNWFLEHPCMLTSPPAKSSWLYQHFILTVIFIPGVSHLNSVSK